jgi:hypothetical protein
LFHSMVFEYHKIFYYEYKLSSKINKLIKSFLKQHDVIKNDVGFDLLIKYLKIKILIIILSK